MKHIIIIWAFIVLPISHFAQNDTTIIRVEGNCGMCKNRIEKFAKLNGVTYANWDMETSNLSLVFDSLVATLDSIEISIANQGHTTSNYYASEYQYNQLPGCCQYVREGDSKKNNKENHHLLITGKVFENANNIKAPLFGANIYWLETTEGLISNDDGTFEIERHQGEDTLIVSFVGLGADTIAITNEKSIEIVLSNNSKLREYIVTSRVSSTTISSFNTLKIERMGVKELAKAPCCNLSESFETNPSVDVTFNDAVTGTRQIQMLGLSGPNIQINSGNLPDVRGFASLQGLTFIPGPWIKNIYLNKGTGSVVNGFESIAGQIDVELKNAEEKLNVNLYGNQGGRLEGNVSIGTKLNDYVSTITHLHYSNRSVKNDRNNDSFLDMPIGQNVAINHSWKIIGKKGFRANIGVEGNYKDILGGQENFTKSSPIDSTIWGLQSLVRRAKVWAKVGKVFDENPDKSMGLQIQASYFDNDMRYGLNEHYAKQSSLYLNYIFQNSFADKNYLYKTGVSYSGDNFLEKVNTSLFNRTEHIPGVFGELSIKSINRLNLIVGLRADYHNIYGAFLTPRIHAKYELAEKTDLRFSFGRGQRTVNIFTENMSVFATSRQIIIEGDSTKDNYAYGLKPQVAWNTGVSLTHKFELNSKEGVLSFDIYHTSYQNQVIVDWENTNQVSFYNLQGKSYANSFQGQIDYELFKAFDVRLAYRYFDVKTSYKEGGIQAKPYLANHRAFINLAYEIKDSWSFDGTLNWIGETRLPSTQSNPIAFQRGDNSPSYFMLSGQITKKWNKLAVYAGVENALNFTQQNPIIDSENPFGNNFDSSMIWGPIFGRNIYAGLRYTL